ncbi:HTH_Tnp_Tc3_2 domain-containing protein [Trichonephila clavipes]|nr:HTH_Tnp_Tc3_2 domain-containing protein [Trichonephila clavipes]
MRNGIWQLLPKETDGVQHQTCLSRQPSSATGTIVSRQIVYRRLRPIGLYARLVLVSRRTLIWRSPGTRYHQENPIERHHYGITVVQDGSFGEELFLVPELTCMFRV